MERCFAEKASRLAEIRVKYEVKIKEKEDQDLYGDMVNLKVQMELELEEMSKELDAKRKTELARAKEALNVK
jgi:hypothetical protein